MYQRMNNFTRWMTGLGSSLRRKSFISEFQLSISQLVLRKQLEKGESEGFAS